MGVAANEKRILFTLRLLTTLCVVFVVTGITCFAAYGIMKQAAYDKYIGISSATDRSARLDSYMTAIRLDPRNPNAYLRLLETYAEDGIFEKQESEELLSLYNSNHPKLNRHSEQYPELLKQIGFLYINGYNEASTTCIRMALPFLENALNILDEQDEEKQTVACYCKIGSYYENYIWNAASVKEITVSVMESMFTDIESTLEYYHTSEDTSSVFDYLGFSVAVCNLLYDQRDVLAATMPQERTYGILDSIYDNLPEIQSLQKERTKQMVQMLDDNKGTYYDMIERAYSRLEVR